MLNLYHPNLFIGSRFWRTTKIIRAVSEADYNRFQKRRDPPGQSSYITISGSDSEELKPLIRKRKRTAATLDSSSSDSDSSLPRTKVVATSATMKILSDIKSLIGDYHTEVVHLRLREGAR